MENNCMDFIDYFIIFGWMAVCYWIVTVSIAFVYATKKEKWQINTSNKK